MLQISVFQIIKAIYNRLSQLIFITLPVTSTINSNQPAYFGRAGNENDQTIFFTKLRKKMDWQVNLVRKPEAHLRDGRYYN